MVLNADTIITMHIEIKNVLPEAIEEISGLIPEFVNSYKADEYYKRINGKSSLLLMAWADGQPAGFKAGYDKFGDGSFYSWMGGVVPAYRKNKIASLLAMQQEQWAISKGYDSIIFKTRNRHKSMLLFAISNGFLITGVEARESLSEYRVVLRKLL